MGLRIVGNYKQFKVKVRHVLTRPEDLTHFSWNLATLESECKIAVQEPSSLYFDIGDEVFVENKFFKNYSTSDVTTKNISVNTNVYIKLDEEITENKFFITYNTSNVLSQSLNMSSSTYVKVQEEVVTPTFWNIQY